MLTADPGIRKRIAWCSVNLHIAIMKAFIQSFGSRTKKDTKENAGKSRKTSTNNSTSSSSTTRDAKATGKGHTRQMFLDLGQKTFGKNKECPICGMFYVLGDVDDEVRHKQNCTTFRDGPLLSSLKGLKVVAEVEDKRGRKGSVLEIRQLQSKGSSQPSFPESIEHVLSVVRRELGSSDDDEYTGREVVYLYVLSSKMVVGCLIAEEIDASQQHLVRLTAEVTSTDAMVSLKSTTEGSSAGTGDRSMGLNINDESSSARSNSFTDRPSKKPRMAAEGLLHGRPEGRLLLGVRSVWVHHGHRRLHIARTIIDTARKHLLFGLVVLLSDVAFAQPTDDGLKLALGYTRQPAVWGYI